MKTSIAIGVVLMMAAGTTHASSADGFDMIWSDVPIQGEPEPADPDFDGGDWFATGDWSLDEGEPLMVVALEAEEPAVEPTPEPTPEPEPEPEPTPGPVLSLEDFVALYLQSTPAQRKMAMGRALAPMLKGKPHKVLIRRCATHAGELVGDRVVGDFLLGIEPPTAEAAADALVTGIGVCLEEPAKGAEIVRAFVEAVTAALARPVVD